MDASSLAAVEEGDPALDGRMFRRCLGQYGTGIAIITTTMDGARAAVTVNSFASVSLDPPLVLWSIAKTSRSHAIFTSGGGFSVNVLSARQMEVSRHFSSKIDDKFAEADWRPGLNGVPLINGCLATFECETQSCVEGGDHTIVIGLVKRASRAEGEPLLFSQGAYSVAMPHPDVSPVPETNSVQAQSRVEETLLSHIFDAQQLLSETFDKHRRAEGINLATARILACLYDRPGLRSSPLADATLLGQRDTEDALADLQERGCVTKTGEGWVLSPPGRVLREAILSRWRKFQQDQIADIPKSDLRIAVGTLAKIMDKNRNAGHDREDG